ncbi:DUF6520 family protein [Flavobacterium sp.]|uniref:DUF6520 family protein n=1 Tax=Flavobacterium sp. TaxID=239 RepID=UPI00261EB864|nr:DUF6520 family protein [Flavobacterium sp.]MDD3003309.1 DUF6520 family protein [Flavobacterium sp.]
MKITFLKSALPFVAIALSVAATFAFKPAADKTDALFLGATKIAGVCTETEKECQDQATDNPCFSGTHQLWRYVNNTSCPGMLYEIE